MPLFLLLTALLGCSPTVSISHARTAPDATGVAAVLVVVDRGPYGSRAEDLGEYFVKELAARGVRGSALTAEGLELDPTFEKESGAANADALLRLSINGGSNRERRFSVVLSQVGSGRVLWSAHVHGSEYEIGANSDKLLAATTVDRLAKDGLIRGRGRQ